MCIKKQRILEAVSWQRHRTNQIQANIGYEDLCVSDAACDEAVCTRATRVRRGNPQRGAADSQRKITPGAEAAQRRQPPAPRPPASGWAQGRQPRRSLGARGVREMGGAPRNPAPRNHLLVWIAKPSAATAQMGTLQAVPGCRSLQRTAQSGGRGGREASEAKPKFKIDLLVTQGHRVHPSCDRCFLFDMASHLSCLRFTRGTTISHPRFPPRRGRSDAVWLAPPGPARAARGGSEKDHSCHAPSPASGAARSVLLPAARHPPAPPLVRGLGGLEALRSPELLAASSKNLRRSPQRRPPPDPPKPRDPRHKPPGCSHCPSPRNPKPPVRRLCGAQPPAIARRAGRCGGTSATSRRPVGQRAGQPTWRPLFVQGELRGSQGRGLEHRST